MLKNKLFRVVLVLPALAGILLLTSGTAFARGHNDRGHHPYRQRAFYSSRYCATPVLGRLTCLLFNNLARRRNETTYIIVPQEPRAVIVPTALPPAPARVDTVTVSIPNSNGSYTQVTLYRSGTGYTGPQGEYYPGHPTVEQLRTLYGE
ncbi:MAG: hypothetical protein ABH883_06445 [Candidatus Omnitrophota bacterium]